MIQLRYREYAACQKAMSPAFYITAGASAKVANNRVKCTAEAQKKKSFSNKRIDIDMDIPSSSIAGGGDGEADGDRVGMSVTGLGEIVAGGGVGIGGNLPGGTSMPKNEKTCTTRAHRAWRIEEGRLMINCKIPSSS